MVAADGCRVQRKADFIMKKSRGSSKLVSSKRNANLKNQNCPQTPSTRQVRTRTATVSRVPTDEYEFDDSNDFGTGKPFQFVASSGNGNKEPQGDAFTKLVSKKHFPPGHVKDEQKKTMKQKLEAGNNKKTSTPLFSTASPKCGFPRKVRRSPLVSIPKLDLDMTVTPILPVCTPDSAKQEMNKKAGKNEWPVHPQGKPDQNKAKKVPERHSIKTSTPNNSQLEEPKSVFSGKIPSVRVASVKGQKRKMSSSDNCLESSAQSHRAMIKRKKVDSSKQRHPPKLKQNKMNTVVISDKKRTRFLDQNVASRDLKKAENAASNLHKPVTSTPLLPDAKGDNVWQPGKEKMYCTPNLYDSGISLGSGFSSSTETSPPFSLPGFMEDEPLQHCFHEPSSSLVPIQRNNLLVEPVPVMTLESSSKKYKPGKTKKEKGRYSTSKMDAWANAVGQSLEEVESFELLIESE